MFHDPISPKPPKKPKSPWDFKAPKYDDRCRIEAGDCYGVGFGSPVGHENGAKPFAETLPMTSKTEMSEKR